MTILSGGCGLLRLTFYVLLKRMKPRWIENYAGEWEDGCGRTLVIRIEDETTAQVDIVFNGSPLKRPWCDEAPATNLEARYFPEYDPSIEVHLGRDGFLLHLTFEHDEFMKHEESLSAGVSWFEDDLEASEYAFAFDPLERYYRAIRKHVEN